MIGAEYPGNFASAERIAPQRQPLSVTLFVVMIECRHDFIERGIVENQAGILPSQRLIDLEWRDSGHPHMGGGINHRREVHHDPLSRLEYTLHIISRTRCPVRFNSCRQERSALGTVIDAYFAFRHHYLYRSRGQSDVECRA